jgi:hypothetical protein
MRYETKPTKVYLAERRPLRPNAQRARQAERRTAKSRRMAAKTAGGKQNRYRCSLEKNQTGKYTARIRVHFARREWELSVYFLASSEQAALKTLGPALRFLQTGEERLWFWGVDRSDDPNFSEGLLGEAGLKLDRRAEFPARSPAISVTPDGPVTAQALAPLVKSLRQSRAAARVAGD